MVCSVVTFGSLQTPSVVCSVACRMDTADVERGERDLHVALRSLIEMMALCSVTAWVGMRGIENDSRVSQQGERAGLSACV